MLYRRLGRTELQVSELSFGAARGYDRDAFPALVAAIIGAVLILFIWRRFRGTA